MEKKHGSSSYKTLLPFLDEIKIKNYIALLITLIFME